MTKHDLEKLIEIQGKDIYQFCYHLTGSREDADDLYQETLYKAFEKIQKIEDSEDSSFVNDAVIFLFDFRKYGRICFCYTVASQPQFFLSYIKPLLPPLRRSGGGFPALC